VTDTTRITISIKIIYYLNDGGFRKNADFLSKRFQ
jgi:hypothetical protein